ncbi:hypothetical protein [Simkania sp.]|uniref:hypothetical protein n=1 Tax=Simkania sp. TaxID=34094 RepID=UPI003B5203A0
MIHNSYLQLIDQTLAYIQERLPKKETLPLPPTPVMPPPKPKVAEAPPPPVAPKVEKKKEKVLDLHPPAKPAPTQSNRMGTLLKSITPELFLHDTPLPDEKAKRVKNAWNEKSLVPEIPILFQGTHYRFFLENLAKAISLTFAPSRVIEMTSFEQEKKWDLFLESPKLKFILCPDHLIFSSKELLPFYKENPGQKTRFLGNIPLLLLPDLALYYKDPYLKRSLWNVLCQTLN